MFKRIIACVVMLVFMFTAVKMPQVAAAPNPDGYDAVTVSKIMANTNVFNLQAKASVLMEADTGRVILENASHERRPIASITKIMTMLLAMEAIDSGKIEFDDIVVVSEHAASMGGSQAYMVVGERFTVHDLLKAIAVQSCNDASVALAEKIAGSEDAFVTLMNEKAKQLGMNDTYFRDCTGLTDEGHYSTAYDVALMSRELIMKHPKITEYTTIYYDHLREGEKKFDLVNTNKLINSYEGANGLKTGHTNAAGYCLSATAKRNGMQLIAVVLGEPDNNTRVAECRKMLDYGFANFEVLEINKKGDIAQEVEVKKGIERKVNAIYNEDVKLLLEKGEKDKVTKEVILKEEIQAPIEKDQVLGDVIFKVGEKEVGKTQIIAAEEVKKASFIRLFFRMIVDWFSFGKNK